MEREERLCGIERVGEVADAALAATQQLDDSQARRIGEGAKATSRELDVGEDRRTHGDMIHQYLLMCQVAAAATSGAFPARAPSDGVAAAAPRTRRPRRSTSSVSARISSRAGTRKSWKRGVRLSPAAETRFTARRLERARRTRAALLVSAASMKVPFPASATARRMSGR